MIEFEESNNNTSHPDHIKVKLEGKHVGSIFGNPAIGYHYLPKGTKNQGNTFWTLQDCKDSLN